MPPTLPFVIQAKRNPVSISDFVHTEIDTVMSLMDEHGALLFRGFDVKNAEDFQSFIEATGATPMRYTYRSTPRTGVFRDVSTATEYPSRLEIPLHCENAYQRRWPMWISFCCIQPAATGGQTPVADMRRVTAMISTEILDRFAERGVKYIRHYRPWVDLSWQDVFQTDDRLEVARFCELNAIQHRWLDHETLRTEQVCQGVSTHPITVERVFFNQAHIFHVSSLEPRAVEDMVELFGQDRLPRNARFGDDTEINPEDLRQIREAFRASAADINWEQGDIALLDNMRFAHGRRAFTGKRLVLASLLNEHAPRLTLGEAHRAT